MGKKHIEECGFFLFCWIFQISIWIGVIVYVINFTFPKNKLIEGSYYDEEKEYEVTIRTSLGKFCLAYMAIGPISYFIYIALELHSVTYKYLKDFDPRSTFKSKMDQWIKLIPVISIRWDCYHTEGEDDNRKTVSKDKGTYIFIYKSCRDISGKFTIESNSCLKSYVLLNIASSIEFEDKETLLDYNKELENIKSKSNIDSNFNLKESKFIYPLPENQIVLTKKCCCCFLNKWIFIFLTLICLAEFYKIFFYCMGSAKYFTVKKVVSGRKTLYDNEYNQKYYMQNPSIESPYGNTFYEPQMFIQLLRKKTINNTNNNLISLELSDKLNQFETPQTPQNDNETPLLDKKDKNH